MTTTKTTQDRLVELRIHEADLVLEAIAAQREQFALIGIRSNPERFGFLERDLEHRIFPALNHTRRLIAAARSTR